MADKDAIWCQKIKRMKSRRSQAKGRRILRALKDHRSILRRRISDGIH